MRWQPVAFAYSSARSTAAHELRLAAGQRRQAALALGGVAGRQVEQHLLEPVALQARGDLGGENS